MLRSKAENVHPAKKPVTTSFEFSNSTTKRNFSRETQKSLQRVWHSEIHVLIIYDQNPFAVVKIPQRVSRFLSKNGNFKADLILITIGLLINSFSNTNQD